MRPTVSVHVLVVVACWIIGGAIAVIDAVSDRTLGALAHLFIAAGATLFIVGRLEKMASGWVAAYEAGREVTRLRSTSKR